MSRPQASDLVKRATLWRRFRLTFARHYGWVAEQSSRLRGLLGRQAAQRERVAEDRRQVEARARFWAELHEGERQAEAECAKEQGA